MDGPPVEAPSRPLACPRPRRCLLVGNANGQDRYVRVSHHLLGDAADQEMAQPAPTRGAHDDRVGAPRCIENALRRIPDVDAIRHTWRLLAESLVDQRLEPLALL